MGIILFFMVLSAWCAQQIFDIPSCWTRSLHGARQSQMDRSCELIPGLQSLTIGRDRYNETIAIDTDEGPLWLTMDFRLPSWDQGGSLFLVSAACKKCSFSENGQVTFVPLNAHNARFIVVEPKKDPDVTLVCFSTTGGRSPKDVCEYDAKEKSLTVRRFFCEYQDESRAFVSAEVIYENPHDVVIEWGIRADDGTVRNIGEQSPKKLHFALCPPGQCLRKAD